MVTNFIEFLDMSAEELYQDWLDYITSRDPLLQDTSLATFNSILAEAVASEFWITIQVLKQKVQDSSVLTATGAALSAIVLSMLPEGRYPGTKATGVVIFSAPSAVVSNITVPKNTIVAAINDDGSLTEFATDEAVTLTVGNTQVYAEATALAIGTKGNVSTGLVTIIRTPVLGITNCTNDAAFLGGTDQEADEALRNRAIYSIWVNGRATIPLVEEHAAAVEGVREAHVATLGQGDVLLVIDAEDELIPDLEENLLENLAAGATAPGVKGAHIGPITGPTIIGELVNETPDGIITTFTVDDPFISNTERVYLNGLQQTRNVDYTPDPATGTIEVLWTPVPDAAVGDEIQVDYAKEGDTGTAYEIGDCAGAPVWVRTLQFCPTEVEIPFTYEEPLGDTKNGTAIIPAGSDVGVTVKAELDAEYPDATKILSSSYAGNLSFDLFMGKGTYPRLWVAPELQEVDIAITLVLTATPEVGLLASIEASLEAKLASYMIGEELQFADLIKYLYIDYSTSRLFSGIDDIGTFEITCKGETISLATGGGKILIDMDERLTPGTVSVTEVT